MILMLLSLQSVLVQVNHDVCDWITAMLIQSKSFYYWLYHHHMLNDILRLSFYDWHQCTFFILWFNYESMI